MSRVKEPPDLLSSQCRRLDILQAVVDLLAHVDVVLNVFEGGVLGKKL